MYSPTVLEHVMKARNVGPLEGATHEGQFGVPGEGRYILIWLKVRDSVIEDAAWGANGCPATMAAASVVCELCIGRSLAEAAKLSETSVFATLGELPEGKGHAPADALTALRSALKEGVS